MKSARRILWLITLLSISTGIASAQVQTGTPPFASLTGGPDQVNLASLNVHEAFPVFHKPGRGLPFNFDLTFDSAFYQPLETEGGQIWSPGIPICNSGGQCYATGGWSGSPVNVGTIAYLEAFDSEFIYFCDFEYIDGFGTVHLFPDCAAYDYIYGTPYAVTNALATDDSGYEFTATPSLVDGQPVLSSSLYTVDGSAIIPQGTTSLVAGASPGSVIDRNGNEITANADGTFTDTLGLTALSTTGSAASPPIDYTYTDPSGTPRSIEVSYYGETGLPASPTVQTNFGCSGIAEYGPISTDHLIYRITLPDGTYYQFSYEPTPGYSGNVTGRIASVILPTGGTISYTYGSTNDGINCADGSVLSMTRTTPDGTWTYTRSVSGGGSTTTVTDPLSNVTGVQFQGIYETQRTVRNGSSPIQAITTCYNGNTTVSSCPTTTVSLPITERTVYLIWGAQQSEKDTSYNMYGLPTQTSEYDYGSGAPGALLRQTLVTYNSGTTCMPTANSALKNLPCMVKVEDGSSTVIAETTYQYDGATPTPTSGVPQHLSVSNGRGNLTTLTRLVQGSTTVSKNTTYFDTGAIQTANDFKGNATTYAYSSSYGSAYPTTVTNPLSQSTSSTYDPNTGVVTSTTDLNSQTTIYAYDEMMRPQTISFPDAGTTSYAYTDGTQVAVTQTIQGSTNLMSYGELDGMGRPSRIAVANGEGSDDQVDICYDSLGLPGFQSYPYQGSGISGTSPVCSGAGDSFTYDALDRTTSVTHSDGSAISVTFADPCATVTDEQGATREACQDGLGRLSDVIENPSGLDYTTTYTYDATDDMTGVTQGSVTRTFVYDGLSRLTSSTNPESSYSPTSMTNVATTYSYDANGNLVSKTGPAQNQQGTSTVTLTYCYDALNRMTSKGSGSCSGGYVSTPIADYVYDGNTPPSGCSPGSFGYGLAIGKRTGMCEPASSPEGVEAWSYSILSGTGSQVVDQRTTNGVTMSATYQYNHLNSLISALYPSGRVIDYTYNSGNRPISATDGTTGSSYINTVHYWAGGAQCWAVLGGVITAAQTFNTRLQPNEMQGTGSVITYPGSCSGLGSTGSLIDLSYSFNYGSGDNGNVMGITNNINTARSQTFAYEALNRLYTAETTSVSPDTHCWGETYSYDEWANLTGITPLGGSYSGCSQESGLSVTMSNNRISTSGYTYDTPGNLTSVLGVGSYTFNAENQMTQAAGSLTDGYVYDGDGKRVEKTSGGTPFKLYWYDLGGNVLDETDQSGDTNNTSFNEYVYFGGRRIALLAGQ